MAGAIRAGYAVGLPAEGIVCRFEKHGDMMAQPATRKGAGVSEGEAGQDAQETYWTQLGPGSGYVFMPTSA